jgi:hypothetical protein
MLKPMLVTALLAAGLAAAGPALAWQNNGSRTGPNGGTVNWAHGCGPHGHACGRTWSAATPGGRTYNGGATARRTWYGGAVTNRWARGPNGAWYGRRSW